MFDLGTLLVLISVVPLSFWMLDMVSIREIMARGGKTCCICAENDVYAGLCIHCSASFFAKLRVDWPFGDKNYDLHRRYLKQIFICCSSIELLSDI